MDKTHWFGCWKYHHECALARIEQLEKALLKVKETALNVMNVVENLSVQLEINQIIFETERMENNEEHTRHWNQVGEGTGETARWQAST